MRRAFRSLAWRGVNAVGLVLLVSAPSCKSVRHGDDRQTDSVSSREVEDTSAGPMAKAWRLPVVITLRREQLGLPAGSQSTDATIVAMQRAMRELATVAQFEVLALSPAILAVNVRAIDPPDAVRLAKLLSGHRLVASAEVEGMATQQ